MPTGEPKSVTPPPSGRSSRSLSGGRKICIGICAMSKKVNGDPMQNILRRLSETTEFQIIVFPDETILHTPPEEWPIVDCLISFFSDGFPLSSAEKYVELRKPFLVNDIAMQRTLLDRRQVYEFLREAGIPVPKHIIVSRDGLAPGEDPPGFVEGEEFVELDGVRINKPFVEKPVSGEDHNIFIYYAASTGGGVKRLFRKVDNKSGDYDAEHDGSVRREGSFIYETFLVTGGTDVKVYTVGPRYAHAEARKSPVVDGRVVRTDDGKEMRYPVLLSPAEKEIARMVCLVTKQMVCGFDLLRAKGKAYVCDVNGWSFVKKAQKYYDDAAGILRNIIMHGVLHRLPAQVSAITLSENACTSEEDLGSEYATGGHSTEDELRCVLVVARHGDRTPKQKQKMVVTHPPLIALMERHMDSKGKQAKLKTPVQLQELLDIIRSFIAEVQADDTADKGLIEKLRYTRAVLEAGGQFCGVNRKVQLRPVRFDTNRTCVEAQMVIKHGGVLTHAGRAQAERFGRDFRVNMYPENLLRLHNTYRHDLKIYSSDEGRVQTSAAAFTQGMLDLEGGALTPILVSLVKKDATMLDAFGKGASIDIQRSKDQLYSQLTFRPDDPSDESPFLPASDGSAGSFSASEDARGESGQWGSLLDQAVPAYNPEPASADGYSRFKRMPPAPLELMHRVYQEMKLVVDKLQKLSVQELHQEQQQEMETAGEERRPYSTLMMSPSDWVAPSGDCCCEGERVFLMYDRWRKLYKAFYDEKKDSFDCSKIPDIYDAVKYDTIHNSHLGLPLATLYENSRVLADCVIPNEYGITAMMRRRIGARICCRLLGKIIGDVDSMRDEGEAMAGSMDSLAIGGDGQEGSMSLSQIKYMQQLESQTFGSPTRLSQQEGDKSDSESEEENVHRLCPTASDDIRSPLRHVRTRIYFTSESHIHALVNVLRYAHLGRGNKSEPLISPQGEAVLGDCSECDYMTHIVIRMFERREVPVGDPERYRIEILFSPGATLDPDVSVADTHCTKVKPCVPLHDGTGLTLDQFHAALEPFAIKWGKVASYWHRP
eukprot:NODE_77_length_3467_cov_41.352838_g69_i0.p1 GENE.NODE_77_length_3467_cov_41.352838_g69_i0~~NODE_77_length_3467_cov_41.352838_g69_i0.p1  ORF type:complete len:1052 (+),score=181.10 NODE_77_length_3467_cov_41.352838_g69_i0:103-3258(+)